MNDCLICEIQQKLNCLFISNLVMDFGGPYIYMPELLTSETNPPSATFQVPITDDIIPELTECFICEIISINGPNCAVIGSPNQTQICIKDNDGENLCNHVCVCFNGVNFRPFDL